MKSRKAKRTKYAQVKAEHDLRHLCDAVMRKAYKRAMKEHAERIARQIVQRWIKDHGDILRQMGEAIAQAPYGQALGEGSRKEQSWLAP